MVNIFVYCSEDDADWYKAHVREIEHAFWPATVEALQLAPSDIVGVTVVASESKGGNVRFRIVGLCDRSESNGDMELWRNGLASAWSRLGLSLNRGGWSESKGAFESRVQIRVAMVDGSEGIFENGTLVSQ